MVLTWEIIANYFAYLLMIRLGIQHDMKPTPKRSLSAYAQLFGSQPPLAEPPYDVHDPSRFVYSIVQQL